MVVNIVKNKNKIFGNINQICVYTLKNPKRTQNINLKDEVDILNVTAALDETETEIFVNQYIKLIGQIGNKNNTLGWWASYISSKNIFMSSFFSDIYNYYCLCQYILKNPNKDIYVICQNEATLSQLLAFLKINNITFTINYRSRNFLPNYKIYGMINTLYFIGKNLIKIAYSKLLFSKKIDQLNKQRKKYYAIRSWFYYRSFTEDKGYHDSFFGILPEYISRRTDLLIIAGIFNEHIKVIKRISKENNYNIIPEEAFLSYLDTIRTVLMAEKIKLKPEGPVKINRIEITEIFKLALAKDNDNSLKTQLLQYYIIKRLTEHFDLNTYLTTYENNPWEKVVFLALKKFSPETTILGYQHTLLNNSSINFKLAEEEKGITPEPDFILTIGDITSKNLINFGYSKDKIIPSCGLRFDSSFNINGTKKRKHTTTGLLVLGGISERAIKLIEYVYKEISSENINIIIRPHPALPFSGIEKEFPEFILPKNWKISKNNEPRQDIEYCDFILYDASTLCLDALLCGIPAIHINLGGIFNYDPLFQFHEFKWEISTEDKLIDVINTIKELSDSEYYIKQNMGKQYAECYILPVNDKNLKKFLECGDKYDNKRH